MRLDYFIEMIEQLIKSLFSFDFSDFASSYMTNLSIWGIVALVGVIITVVGFILKFAVYILSVLPMYLLARRKGLESPWLSLIPIARNYTLCQLGEGSFCIGKYTLFKNRTNAFWVFIALKYFASIVVWALELVFSVFPVLGMLTALIPLAVSVSHHIIRGTFIFDMLKYFRPRSNNNSALAVITELGGVLLADLILPIVLWSLAVKKQENNIA